jgi:hypothetical protein
MPSVDKKPGRIMYKKSPYKKAFHYKSVFIHKGQVKPTCPLFNLKEKETIKKAKRKEEWFKERKTKSIPTI